VRLFADDPKASSSNVSKSQWLSSLLVIPWLSVLVCGCPPQPILPWSAELVSGRKGRVTDPAFLAAPGETRPVGVAWFASYSLRLLDRESPMAPMVAKAFGWEAPAEIKIVVEQLVQLSAKLMSYSSPAVRVRPPAPSPSVQTQRPVERASRRSDSND
jgi:hypothetical protein